MRSPSLWALLALLTVCFAPVARAELPPHIPLHPVQIETVIGKYISNGQTRTVTLEARVDGYIAVAEFNLKGVRISPEHAQELLPLLKQGANFLETNTHFNHRGKLIRIDTRGNEDGTEAMWVEFWNADGSFGRVIVDADGALLLKRLLERALTTHAWLTPHLEAMRRKAP